MKPFYEIREPQFFAGEICRYPFSLHMHGVVEIVHLKTGTLTLTVNTRRHDLAPGDTIVIFPHMPHSYDSISDDMDGLCVIFPPELIPEYAETFRSMRPVSPFLPAARVTSGINEAAEMLIKRSREIDSPFIQCYMHVFVTHIMMLMELEPLSKYLDDGLLQRIIEYIADHFEENLTLESVAAALFVSSSHLSHVFSKQLNVSFRKYINILRIDKACALLRGSEMSITEISYACGYNNPRTFHRAFMEEKGKTPQEYRIR